MTTAMPQMCGSNEFSYESIINRTLIIDDLKSSVIMDEIYCN